jgi:integrase
MIQKTEEMAVNNATQQQVNLLTQAADLSKNTISEATRSAYFSDTYIFQNWCEMQGVDYFPTSPAVLAMYCARMHQLGKKPSTIRRALTAIRRHHLEGGYPDPVDHRVKLVEKGIRREQGTEQRKAAPITLDRLKRIIDTIDRTSPISNSREIKLRDRAMLLVGWSGALRRSEIAALDVDDIEDVPEGIIVHLRRSKTDQEGKGRAVPVPFIHEEFCPVRALRLWLYVADIRSGPIFVQIGQGLDDTRRRRIAPRTITTTVKKWAKRAGYDPRNYSGHSLRAGFATSAAAAGVHSRDIMKITGHRSAATMEGYVRDGTHFRNHPLTAIFGQLEFQYSKSESNSST